jgi:hypothetical protein
MYVLMRRLIYRQGLKLVIKVHVDLISARLHDFLVLTHSTSQSLQVNDGTGI